MNQLCRKSDVLDRDSDSEEEEMSPVVGRVKLLKCLNEGTHRDFADMYYFLAHEWNVYINACQVGDKIVIYKWNIITCLYSKVKSSIIYTEMMDNFNDYFGSYLQDLKFKIKETGKDASLSKRQKKEKLKKLHEEEALYQKVMSKIGTCSFMREVADKYIHLEINKYDNFIDKLDSNQYAINFRNGIIDIKEDIMYIDSDDYEESMTTEDVVNCQQSLSFRKREPLKDFYTFCLDFDFSPKYNVSIYDELCTIIYNICNNNDVDTELIKSYFGYSMLGINKEQISGWLIGPLSCNGKSTLIAMFMIMFSCYSKKISNKTFEKGFQKHHKQFAEIVNKRFVFLEEISKKNMDVDLFKDLVADKVLGSNEVLFGTTMDIPITFTFVFTSNNNPKFQSDNGVKRRGMIIEMNNEFLDINKIEKRRNRGQSVDRCHVKDKEILDRMEDEEYKLALFHIFYEYAILYCLQKKILCCDEAIKRWKGVCKDNDPVKAVIEQFFVITGNNDDRIHKDEFLNFYKSKSRLENITFNNVLNDLKRLKVVYDRTKRIMVEDPISKKKISMKGVLIGIREKTDAELEDEGEDKKKEEPPKPFIPKKGGIIEKILNCNKNHKPELKNIDYSSSSSEEAGDYDDNGDPPEIKVPITQNDPDGEISLDGIDD